MERTGPVPTETGVLSFMLSWDISEDAMGEMEVGFALDEIETDGVEWARRPKIGLGHKKSLVKDDRSGIPRIMQFRGRGREMRVEVDEQE
jgi:hypothetical protein